MAEKIGFGIFGKEKDYLSHGNKKRMVKLRPNVALATQQEIRLDKYILVYQPEQEDMIKVVLDDIKAINEEQGYQLEIIKEKITFTQKGDPNAPFDFGQTFRKIEDLILRYNGGRKNQQKEWYLNVGTGTHAMQFSMYYIADKRWFDFPLQLIQPIKGCLNIPEDATKEEKLSADIRRVTTGSTPYRINVDCPVYREVSVAINTKRKGYESELLPAGTTQHKDWASNLKTIGTIGRETNEPLLLLGETGTGKSRLAKNIHELWCAGEGRPFMETNCAGLRGQLIRSELFGHIKGAYTGAVKDRVGLLEKANGGTLFLDEIGELDLETQAQLLKALEEKSFYRVGDLQNKVSSNFRLICATNRNLAQMSADGEFRLDLYARIRSWEYTIPALKNLRDDIETLIEYQLARWNEEKKSESRGRVDFAEDARQMYLDYAKDNNWSGNHRDLMQSVYRLATKASLPQFGAAATIGAGLVKEEINYLRDAQHCTASEMGSSPSNSMNDFARMLKERYPNMSLVHAAEAALRKWSLDRNAPNRTEAAREIYTTEDASLTNPSAVFTRRGNFLRKNNPDQEGIY